jgi:hypothetical protein
MGPSHEGEDSNDRFVCLRCWTNVNWCGRCVNFGPSLRQDPGTPWQQQPGFTMSDLGYRKGKDRLEAIKGKINDHPNSVEPNPLDEFLRTPSGTPSTTRSSRKK